MPDEPREPEAKPNGRWHSEELGELAAALAAAQAKIENPKKRTDNPFFRSRYADLPAVWDACRDALTENGLAVTQIVSATEHGYELVTMLIHSSGQWIRSSAPLRPASRRGRDEGGGWVPAPDDPQALGTVIQYMRRYQLASIAGVCPEDEDTDAEYGPGSREAARERAAEGGADSSPARARGRDSAPGSPPRRSNAPPAPSRGIGPGKARVIWGKANSKAKEFDGVEAVDVVDEIVKKKFGYAHMSVEWMAGNVEPANFDAICLSLDEWEPPVEPDQPDPPEHRNPADG